jgi:glycosyltransferase involved in cell wall biosynthesis
MEFTEVPSWIKDNIDFLIDKADIIITSSQNLFNKLKIKRKHNLFLVGNGVEVEHFKKARENIEISMDIKSTKKPIIGYIGTIGEWFDFELIESILKFYPNISIVLIGPIFLKQKPEINKLESLYPNLFVLGKKSYSILPNYIKAFDVCIIPFKINELTLSVNPNKLYEYLAAGKPVISTALPEVEKYNGTVYMAKNTDEFLWHINKVLTSTHDAEKFLSIAFENSWDEKAKSIINLVKKA